MSRIFKILIIISIMMSLFSCYPSMCELGSTTITTACIDYLKE